MTSPSLTPEQIEALRALEIRYHNAMPNWVKLAGLKIKAVHECEGGGFCIDKAQGEAIVGALTDLLSTRTRLDEVAGQKMQAEFNAMAAENVLAAARRAITRLEGELAAYGQQPALLSASIIHMLVLCGEPECADVDGLAEKLRALIDGLIAQRSRADTLATENAALRARGPVRYTPYRGETIDDAERARIIAHPLYQLGDTVLVWVSEGDLYMGSAQPVAALSSLPEGEPT